MSSSSHTESVLGGNQRLLVESVGTANAGVVKVVQQIVPLPAADVARLIYQAPSELVGGLTEAGAKKLAELLRSAGLQIRVCGPEHTFDPGVGDYEVALSISDATVIPAVIREVAALLGLEVGGARRLVCSMPAVLLASVSKATVDAVVARFAAFALEVDVSRTAESSYYAVIASSSPRVLLSLRNMVATQVPRARVTEGDGALTVSELDHAMAQQLFEHLQRSGARSTVCNLDFVRYDVQLEDAPSTPAMQEYLESLGIPRRVISRVLRELPVVIQQNVRHGVVEDTIRKVSTLGGTASGIPYSSQRFALAIETATNAPAAIRTLHRMGKIGEAEATNAVEHGNGTLVGSFTKTTAMWLRHELERQGTRARLETR